MEQTLKLELELKESKEFTDFASQRNLVDNNDSVFEAIGEHDNLFIDDCKLIVDGQTNNATLQPYSNLGGQQKIKITQVICRRKSQEPTNYFKPALQPRRQTRKASIETKKRAQTSLDQNNFSYHTTNNVRLRTSVNEKQIDKSAFGSKLTDSNVNEVTQYFSSTQQDTFKSIIRQTFRNVDQERCSVMSLSKKVQLNNCDSKSVIGKLNKNIQRHYVGANWCPEKTDSLVNRDYSSQLESIFKYKPTQSKSTLTYNQIPTNSSQTLFPSQQHTQFKKVPLKQSKPEERIQNAINLSKSVLNRNRYDKNREFSQSSPDRSGSQSTAQEYRENLTELADAGLEKLKRRVDKNKIFQNKDKLELARSGVHQDTVLMKQANIERAETFQRYHRQIKAALIDSKVLLSPEQYSKMLLARPVIQNAQIRDLMKQYIESAQKQKLVDNEALQRAMERANIGQIPFYEQDLGFKLIKMNEINYGQWQNSDTLLAVNEYLKQSDAYEKIKIFNS